MNHSVLKSASRLIPQTYVQQALESKCSLDSKIKELIEKCHCPEKGWDENSIEYLLRELSLMDSNNFSHNAGVGEREARIFSGIVSRRHYGLGHGVGRSGDLIEPQPKAAGSSLLYKLINLMVKKIIQVSGIKANECIVVPLATGMSIVLCLLAIRKKRPEAKYVIWPRIDQKSCFKSISAAGFVPLVIENQLDGDELRTDINAVRNCVEINGASSIAAILTTTSCFAPRAIDKIEEISALCKEYDIPHVINNAYGLQSSKITHQIQQASRLRVDAFIQSTDKNFMVPVGGSIIAGFDKSFIQTVSKTYPGRASSSPIVDLFVTLLSMGVEGYKKLLSERNELKTYMESELEKIAEKFSLKVLKTKNNPISIALSLPNVSSVTEIGSKLFLRGISGTRVIDGTDEKIIEGHTFKGWGSHCNEYPTPYLTAAASIGMSKRDVDVFITKLDGVLSTFVVSQNGVQNKEVSSKDVESSLEEKNFFLKDKE